MTNEEKAAARKALEALAKRGGPRISGPIVSGGNINIGKTVVIVNNGKKG